jgi:hypothetical protein
VNNQSQELYAADEFEEGEEGGEIIEDDSHMQD